MSRLHIISILLYPVFIFYKPAECAVGQCFAGCSSLNPYSKLIARAFRTGHRQFNLVVSIITNHECRCSFVHSRYIEIIFAVSDFRLYHIACVILYIYGIYSGTAFFFDIVNNISIAGCSFKMSLHNTRESSVYYNRHFYFTAVFIAVFSFRCNAHVISAFFNLISLHIASVPSPCFLRLNHVGIWYGITTRIKIIIFLARISGNFQYFQLIVIDIRNSHLESLIISKEVSVKYGFVRISVIIR